MFNDIDTSILDSEEQNYLKTVFNDEILRKRYLQKNYTGIRYHSPGRRPLRPSSASLSRRSRR